MTPKTSHTPKTSDTGPGQMIRNAARAAPEDAAAAAERFAERAEKEGLVEVAYASADSPFGQLLVAATERGVVHLNLPVYDPAEFLARISAEISPAILESPRRLDRARRELDAYFEGKLTRFTVPLDWQLAHGFQERVLRATYAIPYGHTLSYGEVAAEAGNPRAFRAAGTALGHNPLPLIVPCHRVLRAGGDPGNYGGGPEMKKALLRLEGALPG
jgi:methylated-DNA-[protein]-cysteine S-methyltransferase